MKTLIRKYSTPVGNFKQILLDEEKSLRLVLTGKCNMACEFCIYKIKDFYSPEIHSPEFIEMQPTRDLYDALEKMKNELNFNVVHFTGGEPTLSENIRQIAEMAKKLGLLTSICSNLINIKKLLTLLNRRLIGELTFSYFPLDGKGNRGSLPEHVGPNVARSKTVEENIQFIRLNFPELKIKTNICISAHTDLKDLKRFIQWCWERNIVPRIQRDRSMDRISGATQKTINLLKMLKMKPNKVVIRVPGNTELCKFKNSDGEEVIIKLFNQNFRLQTICNFCNDRNGCAKSLSTIRLYDTKNDPKLCFCTSNNGDFAHLALDQFVKSEVFAEIKKYKDNKQLYFKKFCINSNFQ